MTMIPTLSHAGRARPLNLNALLLSLAAFWLAAATDMAAALPPDPAIRMGELPNGMRYWIRPNQTPPGKVYVWLRINTGSLPSLLTSSPKNAMR